MTNVSQKARRQSYIGQQLLTKCLQILVATVIHLLKESLNVLTDTFLKNNISGLDNLTLGWNYILRGAQ